MVNILGSPPKGFMLSRKIHDRALSAETKSLPSKTAFFLSQKLLLLKDINDLYSNPQEDSKIVFNSEIAKKKIPCLLKRNKIISEIISTEETYVNQLESLVNIYVRPIRALDILPKEAYECLFSNVESIYLLHKM